MPRNKRSMINNNSLIPIQPKKLSLPIINNMKGSSGSGIGSAAMQPNMDKEKFFKWYNEMCQMHYKEFFMIEFLNAAKKWNKILVEQQPKERHLSVCQVCDMVLQISPRTISEHCCGKRHRQHLTIKAFDFRKIISNNNTASATTANESQSHSKTINEAIGNSKNIGAEKDVSRNVVIGKVDTAKNIGIEKGVRNQIHKIIDSTEDNTEKVNEIMHKLLRRIPDMLLNDLEKIEFKFIDTDWKKMFIRIDNRYDCMLCNSNRFSNLIEMRSHLLKTEHKHNLKLVTGLHHPISAPIKDLNYQENRIILKLRHESNDSSMIVKNPFAKLGSTEYINPFAKPITKEKEELNETVTSDLLTKDIPDLVKSTEIQSNVESVVIVKDPINLIEKNEDETHEAETIEDETNHTSALENYSNKNETTLENPFKNSSNTNENRNIEATCEATLNDELNSQEITPTKRNKKLNDQEFREIIDKLEIGQTIEIEFYKNNVWRKMIQWFSKNFACKLCSVQQISNFKNLQEHLRGKNHQNKMTSVVKFFHPKLTLEHKNINETTENARQIDANAGTIKITINSNANKSEEPKVVTEAPETVIDDDVIITNDHTETITLEDSPERELPQLRTPTLLKNPIVFNSDVSSNNECEKPHYEKDKIMTVRYKPSETTNKNMNQSNKNSSPANKSVATEGQPSFSVKSFIDLSDVEVEGFIGVEYVVRMLKHVSNFPRFECCLCERELDGSGMQDHLKSCAHRIKYLERHFPTCWKSFRQYRNDNAVIAPIIEKLSIAIEKYHGRDLPFECDESEFRSNRQGIMSKVYSFRHASELSGPSFTNIVDKKTLDGILKNKDKYKTSTEKKNQPTQISRVEKRARENSPSFTHRNEKQKTYPFVTQSDAQSQRLQQQPRLVQSSATGPTIPIIQPRERMFPKLNRPMVPPHLPNRNQWPPMFMNAPQFSTQTFFSPPTNFIPQMIDQNYSQSMMPSFQPNNQTLDDEEHKRLAERFIQNTKIQERRQTRSPKRRNSKSQQDFTSNRQRSRSPLRRRRSPSKSPLRDDDVWQAYRRKFDYDVKILNIDFETYRKDPNSYPTYNEEWEAFWGKRAIELKEKGIDHRQYDFTPEWTKFFLDRLEEIYENDIEDLKHRLRQRFVLPMHNEELSNKKYEKYRLKQIYPEEDEELEPPLPPCITSSSKSSSPILSNKSDMLKSTNREKITCLSSEDENYDSLCLKKKKKKYTSKEDDALVEEVTTVSVLRLLTVLEDNLGSLGPKVIDLLTKALTLEKTKLNASGALLLIMDNCVFLETCREKLKGQIAADCIPERKLRAVRQAIKDITILVDNTNEKRLKNPDSGITKKKIQIAKNQPLLQRQTQQKNVPSTSKSSNITQISSTLKQHANISQAISMTQAEKKEMAQKLTTLLMGMGKTDISSQLCEELVEVYQAIDQKKIGQIDGQENCLSNKLLKIIGELQKQQKQQQTIEQSRGNERQHLNPEKQIVQSHQLRTNNFGNLSNFDTSLNVTSANANKSLVNRNAAANDQGNNNTVLSHNYQVPSLSNQHLRNAMQALLTINNSQQVSVRGQFKKDSSFSVHSNTSTLYQTNNRRIPNNSTNNNNNNNNNNRYNSNSNLMNTNPVDATYAFNHEMYVQQPQLNQNNSIPNNNSNFNSYPNFNRNNANDKSYGRGNNNNNNNNRNNNNNNNNTGAKKNNDNTERNNAGDLNMNGGGAQTEDRAIEAGTAHSSSGAASTLAKTIVEDKAVVLQYPRFRIRRGGAKTEDRAITAGAALASAKTVAEDKAAVLQNPRFCIRRGGAKTEDRAITAGAAAPLSGAAPSSCKTVPDNTVTEDKAVVLQKPGYRIRRGRGGQGGKGGKNRRPDFYRQRPQPKKPSITFTNCTINHNYN